MVRLTEHEAIASLRASPRLRRRQTLGAALLWAIFGAVGVTLLFVWWWDYPWDHAAIHGAVWFAFGGIGGWLIASTDSMNKVAAEVESVVPAELIKVDGQKVTVRQDDGTELMWAVESPRKLRMLALEIEQGLWLAEPAQRGKPVLAVVSSKAEGRETTTILWPGDVAWTPGRWD